MALHAVGMVRSTLLADGRPVKHLPGRAVGEVCQFTAGAPDVTATEDSPVARDERLSSNGVIIERPPSVGRRATVRFRRTCVRSRHARAERYRVLSLGVGGANFFDAFVENGCDDVIG